MRPMALTLWSLRLPGACGLTRQLDNHVST
jgi:hypothetical protein